VFLTLETSPGNFQAWAAVKDAPDKDFVRRFRKGAGADATASGATRVAGSVNFKDKYGPEFSARGDPRGASGPRDDAGGA
jgi:RepB DNA-primase from phage plasmid